MSIEFRKDTDKSGLYNVYKYDDSASTFHKKSTTDMSIADDLEVGDSIVFQQANWRGGKCWKIEINVDTAVVADTFEGVWVDMKLEELDTPRNVDEFNEAAGDFTWVLHNTNGANLDQCVAYLDAIATVAEDINAHTDNVTIGKDVNTWYTYNASGQIVTRSGADNKGLYIENIPTADQQRILFTADDGTTKSYAFSVSVNANVGATAKADPKAWYHSFFAEHYNTSNAVTVQDKAGNPVKGLASDADANNTIIFSFDYTGDTVGGTANTDKNCVFLCEGDGGATQAKTLYTITKQTVVSFSCSPTVENNA